MITKLLSKTLLAVLAAIIAGTGLTGTAHPATALAHPSAGSTRCLNLQDDCKSWTLMYYFAIDSSNLAALKTEYEQVLEYAQRNPGINVTAYFDGATVGDTEQTAVAGGVRQATESLVEKNSADPDTLQRFLEWSALRYPALQYALIVHGHAKPDSGVVFDSYTQLLGGDGTMQPGEFKTVLESFRYDFDRLNILNMQGCLMANLEFQYQVRGLADLYIASESLAWAPYPERYAYLLQPGSNPTNMAMRMAQNYYDAVDKAASPGTISVVNLPYVEGIKTRVDGLARAISSQMWNPVFHVQLLETLDPNNVQRFYSQEFGGIFGCEISRADKYADLRSLAERLKGASSDTVVTAADGLASALERYVLYSRAWSARNDECKNVYWDHSGAHGVSIVWPSFRPLYYTGALLDFAAGTDWTAGDNAPAGPETPAADAWGPMLVEMLNRLGTQYPDAALPPDPVPPLAPPPLHSNFLFLPYVRRGFSSVWALDYINASPDDAEIGRLECAEWPGCRGASSGNYLAAGYALGTVSADYLAGAYGIRRVFLAFDTSGLPDTAEIVGAGLSFLAGDFQAGDTAVHVVRSQAGLPPLAGDFGKLAWESGGWILSTVPGTWNQVNLNAIGLKWINKTGLTRLALVANPDMFDYPPACGNSITVSMAGEGRAPVLSVQVMP